MAAAAGVSRAAVIADSIHLDADVMARFERMVGRRTAREPLAYIVGHREFYSLEFVVRPGVLIPRPETETVVEAALGFLRERPAAKVLDIGTGSGAIAIAMAANAPEAQIVAIDISKVSLEVAGENARRHGCAGRIAFVEADYAALDARALPFASFDLIVSNPPYITEAELPALAPEVRDFEPRLALDGGVDGMEFYRKIAAGLARWLAPEGEVILEVGAGQAEAVEAIIVDAMRIRSQIGRSQVGRSQDARGWMRRARASARPRRRRASGSRPPRPLVRARRGRGLRDPRLHPLPQMRWARASQKAHFVTSGKLHITASIFQAPSPCPRRGLGEVRWSPCAIRSKWPRHKEIQTELSRRSRCSRQPADDARPTALAGSERSWSRIPRAHPIILTL